ncbi:MAG: aminotransferase class I/II-fold pyridoxal phosphate-dependent enzyme [Lutibacter sp.]|uniref:DegT/DnrJ/EryC1/StrS family aminotransferase n=1 Tax=Lutibacter sp. TaxID=1925666 RepID=UPI001837F7E9|nr:aminotransferase class I/II-fold pyridoxal phosphate-dependent enzyme [Lutibacter sp.]MBT8318242.1 aminotransferase class I/II-fold pyridoxal phosphate-dependent enzyme [Lutibacter sp.]NNJ59101.1 aminotransferase class I/II-fold pyridoxal phosphate-dependent enzyme [Lutibacter sp.]
MKNKIWLSSPHMGGNENTYIQEAFNTNWIAPLGPNVNAFEDALQHYVGGKKEIAALSSGTSAIHLALILLGVTKGDEVICQSFTFAATVNPIVYQGATPIFVDSELETWNLCPEQLELAIEDRIKNGKKPKAIIAVHLYGMPYQVNKIKELSVRYNIPIIEDAASALGSEVNGQKCGTFGDFGILSFNGNKIITTSGGGALICENLKCKEDAIFLATQARDKAPHYEHSAIGYNYRMSNVLAGIGRGQMEVVQERVKSRRNNYLYYYKALKHKYEFLQEPEGYFSNRWLTCIITDSYATREKIRLALQEQNIESRPLWKPMHLQPIFQKYPRYINGISENLFDKGLCLPSGSNNTEKELNRIIEILKHC